jgi:endonuclease/exonuclease/phosphatase family metal-dependent hydrolase
VTLRLVSINIWDLPVPLPWLDRARRRRRLLEQLQAMDADLILIQEAFIPDFKRRLASALSAHHSDRYLTASRRAGWIRLDGSGGLLTLSRWPQQESTYLPFRSWTGMKPDERVGRKGALWSQVDTPRGRLVVGNTHLYAGNSARDARVRSIQTTLLLRQLDRMPAGPVIVAGDFNMALELENGVRSTGFDLMSAAGFQEISAGVSAGLVTMTPRRNVYARLASRFWSDRRLTQVFVRGLSIAAPPRVCLNQPAVSDHYGLTVDMEIVQ